MFLEGVGQKLAYSSITKINPFSRRSSYIPRSFILTIFVLLVASSVGALDRSDLCIKQPVDQCSGNQLIELGQQDADFDGYPYLFESSISSASENGDVTLQFKGEDSTGFSDVSTDPFSTRMGSSTDLYSNLVSKNTQDEGSTKTLTINGAEHNIKVESVDLGANTFQISIDGGVNTYSGDIGDQVGDLFGEGEKTQFLDAAQNTQENLIYSNYVGDCVVREHTGNFYEICNNAVYSGNPDSADFSINGTSFINVDQGDIVQYDSRDFLLDTVYTDIERIDIDEYLEVNSLTYGFQSDVDVPEGHLEYRLRWDGDSGSTVWSPSLFFSLDRGDNLPYDEEVAVEGQTVQNPLKVTGITPGSGITVTVAQNENDPVNVTLVNKNTGSDVATIKGNRTDQGAFYTIYSDVKNEVLATFLDTSSNNAFTFPIGGSDLLSSQATEYDFYFEIKERTATSDTRTTKVYTAETSGTATNPAPQINSVEGYNGDSWVPVQDIAYNKLYKIRADVTDSNNDFLDIDLTYNNDYDGSSELEGLSGTDSSVSYSEKNGSYYVWDGDQLENNTDSGQYSLKLNASDGNTYTTESRSWSYPFGEPDVSFLATSSVVENNFFYPEITVSCPQYECVNQNETIDVYLDPMEVAS